MKNAVKVIFWDVYGTLLAAERGDLESLLRREQELRAAFELTVRNYALPIPAAVLHERFLERVQGERAARATQGIKYPEVRIEEIWLGLLTEVAGDAETTLGLAREVAMFFERHANPKTLQEHALETLTTLHARGFRQGIISNAQFYTPIELSELLYQASAGRIRTFDALFESKLVFLSCNFGVAKPDVVAFHRAIEVLSRDGVRPHECLLVGDSSTNDIVPARTVGFHAVLYAPAKPPEPGVRIQKLSQLLELV